MAAGDGLKNSVHLGLGPQPVLKTAPPKSCDQLMKEELDLNRSRLTLTRKVMRSIKEEIGKWSVILKREMGGDVDIPALVRTGGGSGFLERAQEVINLRVKLSGFKSQFLQPGYKAYYLGPFDPRKEKFDLRSLPQKQEDLYYQVLDDDKKARLKQRKPLEALKQDFKELSLMYRASGYRTKSLNKKLSVANSKLLILRAQTQDHAKVIEYMISHQNLLKLMLDPDTLELDENVPRVYSEFQIEEIKVESASDVHKFKTLYEKSDKEIRIAKEKATSIADMLDKNNDDLIKTEAICTENKRDLEILNNPPTPGNVTAKDKKKPPKKSDPTEVDSKVELELLVEENNHLRNFLLSPVLSNGKDFKLFLLSLQNAKEEFLHSFMEIKKISFNMGKLQMILR